MAYTQQDFQKWVSLIDGKMEEFTTNFAKENRLLLDYTADSLKDLERWIFNTYSNSEELKKDSRILDGLTIYIGETFRKYIGGKWVMDLENKESPYYAMPALSDISYLGSTYITPSIYALDCIDRKDGHYIKEILMKFVAPKLKTIDELVEFMEREYYPFYFIEIGKYKLYYQGEYLEKDENGYVYGYSEKGHKNPIERFDNETDAVQYVFKEFYTEKLFNGYLVAATFNHEEILEAEKELNAMFIPFERNDVPSYNKARQRAYRIFIFGKNIQYLKDFERKFYHELD